MVRVYSRVLKDTIVCVEDGQAAVDAAGRVLYTRSEVEMLRGQPAAVLRAVHEAKKRFGGRYLGPAPRRER